MPIVAFDSFRTYLWDHLPEARGLLQTIAEEETEEAAELEVPLKEVEAGTYELVSRVYWWGVFHPALERRDEKEVERCYAVLEDLLRHGDENLVQCLEVRVVAWLASADWVSESRVYAGERLRARLIP
ncbi:hypothetical protein DQ384_03710 [Sphaerisporangium album]|uniref:Uncharacterized protein n=1 Tax=Sphaerisporangium album TaxID=509200 RepID=A0A367FSE0_9ACTN|nr:hypothetical protein DQ384_03710 [Sphaerisporangium album]